MQEKVKFLYYDDPFSVYSYHGHTYVYNPEYGSWTDTTTDTLVTDEKLLAILSAVLQEHYVGPDNPPLF
jgi:hypothetical protein